MKKWIWIFLAICVFNALIFLPLLYEPTMEKFYLDRNDIYVGYKQIDHNHSMIVLGRDKDKMRDTILVACGRNIEYDLRFFISEEADDSIYIKSDYDVIIHSENDFKMINCTEYINGYRIMWIDPALKSDKSCYYTWGTNFDGVNIYYRNGKKVAKIKAL